MLWLNLSRPYTKDLTVQEIEKPLRIGEPKAAKVNVTDLTQIKKYNPFELVPHDFLVGDYLPLLAQRDQLEAKGMLMPPEITEQDAQWFDKLIADHHVPDVFITAGHGVISEGFHDSHEDYFLFLPTLFDTINKFPAAASVFANIKLAILWGCNTMTNLEPHKADGSYMSPKEIFALYHSGPEGKKAIIGDGNTLNTLEFYRSRLAREYGPNHPPGNKWEYTRGPKFEKCENNVTKFNCEIADVDRLMPDEGLWDGSHRYNYPEMMSKLFPHATLVLGFSSASPDESIRFKILEATLKKSLTELNAKLAAQGKAPLNNILMPLIDPNTPFGVKREAVIIIQKNWTIETDSMNRGRPSGSVSPLFPELNKYGILGAPLTHGSKQYGPWRPTDDQNAQPNQPVSVPKQ